MGYQIPAAPQLHADTEGRKRAVFRLLNPSPPTQPWASVCLSFYFLDFKWKIMGKPVD